jgi:uncharacterized membrane protein YraQ (UPF0718 family)
MFSWLEHLVDLLVEKGFGLSLESHLGGSIQFFIFDVIKILILLCVMIFLISWVRSFFPPERVRALLKRFPGPVKHLMASLLGVVSPFCSCSTVPLFIGFVEAGIPLGVTFSFLITSPIVNEAAFVVLLASFGWKVAVVYLVVGVVIGVFAGMLIGVLGLESQVESYVREMQTGEQTYHKLGNKQRLMFAWGNVKDIIRRIWIFLLIGIGLGAAIHGWAPQDWLATHAGPHNPLAVVIATVVAVPLYSNAVGTIPIAEALIGKGVGMGTAMAFMLATVALSFPEMILLRKVIRPKLIGIFAGIVTAGIILTGYLFNGIGPWLMK